MKRFQDENKFLGSFMDEIFVKCPKCSCQAFVRRKFESKYASSDSKFFECKHCFSKLENPVYEYIAYGNPYCNNCYEKYEFKSQMLKEIPKVYRAKCPHCNYQEAWKPKILEYFKPMSLEDGMVKDDYFYLTVWFQVSFGDQIFWVLNYDHIDYLKRYIQADLRERNSNIAYSASLVSRLPKFVKEAKNREKLLKILEKWKK